VRGRWALLGALRHAPAPGPPSPMVAKGPRRYGHGVARRCFLSDIIWRPKGRGGGGAVRPLRAEVSYGIEWKRRPAAPCPDSEQLRPATPSLAREQAQLPTAQ
jgi:hypothetical protein